MDFKTLLTKVRRRRDRAFARYVPFNTRFRPAGIVNVKDTGNNDGVEYIELRPPYISRLDLPDRFRNSCSPYKQPVMEVSYPGDYVVQIKDGRILLDTGANMAIVSSTNKLLDEVSFQWKADEVLPASQNAFLQQKGFHKPKHYTGKVFSLLSGGGAKTYFYHWVMDSLPKLGLLQQCGMFDEIDFFLVPNYKLPYQQQFLEHFGINKDKVIDGAAATHLQADYLIVSSYTVIKSHHPAWMCDWLCNSFISPEESGAHDKLIYIARGDSRRNRKALNEMEVIPVLQRYGFEICYLSKMTIHEQSRLFNSARIVIGTHGAGLTNLVFCRPGTQVLELFPETFVLHPYYDISNKRGLHYDFLLCPADGNANSAVEGQKINLTVNVNELEAKVKGML